MLHPRPALVIGCLLLATACLLPCGTFADLSAASLPYQDPTPEMLHDQAAEVSTLERHLAVRLWGSAAVALAGFGVLGYGLRRWLGQRRRRIPGSPAAP